MQREVYRNKHEASETISTLNLGRVTGDGTSEAVWTGVFCHVKVYGLSGMGAIQTLSCCVFLFVYLLYLFF